MFCIFFLCLAQQNVVAKRPKFKHKNLCRWYSLVSNLLLKANNWLRPVCFYRFYCFYVLLTREMFRISRFFFWSLGFPSKGATKWLFKFFLWIFDDQIFHASVALRLNIAFSRLIESWMLYVKIFCRWKHSLIINHIAEWLAFGWDFHFEKSI